VVEGEHLAAHLAATAAPTRHATSSARNRFTSLVTGIKKDTVMAQLRYRPGRTGWVSLMSREALDELGLAIGDIAVAVVKSTTVNRGNPSIGDTCAGSSSPRSPPRH